jgi:uncharacterized membrane protein YhhN
MPGLIWLALAGAGALANWLAVAKGWRRATAVTKPLPVIFLLVWFYILTGGRGAAVWFGVGLIFSLAGDILLLLPARSCFLPGLGTFLLGHISYIIGFNRTPPPIVPLTLVLLAGVVVAVALIYPPIRRGLVANPGACRMRLPVFLYACVLMVMTASAASTLARLDWLPHAGVLAALGGVLFCISDTLLAFDRFVRPIRYGHVIIMVTYHLGQLGIALGAGINFNG